MQVEPIRALLQGFAYRGRFQLVLDEVGREHDLGTAETVALLFLGVAPANITEISSAIGLRTNGASILVERLRARGLVERRRGGVDRRVAMVVLTEAGRSLHINIERSLRDPLNDALSPLSSEELGQLSSLVEKLVRAPQRRSASGRTTRRQRKLAALSS